MMEWLKKYLVTSTSEQNSHQRCQFYFNYLENKVAQAALTAPALGGPKLGQMKHSFHYEINGVLLHSGSVDTTVTTVGNSDMTLVHVDEEDYDVHADLRVVPRISDLPLADGSIAQVYYPFMRLT
jgi:hypothetical protein